LSSSDIINIRGSVTTSCEISTIHTKLYTTDDTGMVKSMHKIDLEEPLRFGVETR
jgi:hypothetical protein